MLSDQDDSVVNRYDSAFCLRLWGISSAGTLTYSSLIALERDDLMVVLYTLQGVLKKETDVRIQPS